MDSNTENLEYDPYLDNVDGDPYLDEFHEDPDPSPDPFDTRVDRKVNYRIGIIYFLFLWSLATLVDLVQIVLLALYGSGLIVNRIISAIALVIFFFLFIFKRVNIIGIRRVWRPIITFIVAAMEVDAIFLAGLSTLPLWFVWVPIIFIDVRIEDRTGVKISKSRVITALGTKAKQKQKKEKRKIIKKQKKGKRVSKREADKVKDYHV